MRYFLFYIFAILVMAEAAILDGQFLKESDILKQLHLQIILIAHFMRYRYLDKIGHVTRK